MKHTRPPKIKAKRAINDGFPHLGPPNHHQQKVNDGVYHPFIIPDHGREVSCQAEVQTVLWKKQKLRGPSQVKWTSADWLVRQLSRAPSRSFATSFRSSDH